jgi:SAM-dependent methyltransferase
MISTELQACQHEQIYSDKHRKLCGMHYTPDSLVDYIVKRTLRPLLCIPDALPRIRVIDPACGSGLFLLKAYEIFADCWQKAFGSFSINDAKYILENSLFGIDINEHAISETKKNLLQKASFSEHDYVDFSKNIVVGDALFLRSPSTLISMFNKGANEPLYNKSFSKHGFDCVIGNPPYVRIQNTPREKREHYTLSYTTAAGRFDVASLFLELSEYLLSEKGRLGFVVSNKILSTAGAKKIRAFLLKHFSIEEIVDLGDTKLFDAAVLPMILIASRVNKNTKQIAYSSITELHNRTVNKRPTTNLLQLLEKTEIPFEANVSFADRTFQVQRFYANPPSWQTNVWSFHNERQNHVLAKIRHNSACTLGELSQKICVGLKTTADNVFIKPMTQEFVQQNALERNLIFPVIESHNIERWTYSWNPQQDLFVLYPHVEKNGKVIPVELDAYPRIKEYLESNRPQLEARTYLTDSKRRWYEIWVHQSPNDFNKRKIITPDLSSHNRFAFDDRGFYVNGTCFYIILMDESDISYYSILGLLNSKVIEYFHKTTSGNSLYAKRFRYWSSYIQEYPIAKRLLTDSDIRSLLARNVADLLNTNNTTERAEFEKVNDRLCYELFSFTENEIREIESTLSVCSPPTVKKGIGGK